MAETTPLTEAMGQIAYYLTEASPYIPMSAHLIASALFPIYTGAHSSLSRPSSAARPPKKSRRSAPSSSDSDTEDNDDDDETDQKMEGLSPSDAILFPLLAGCTLAGLYFLIKRLGPEMINKVLNWYFSLMAVFSVAKLVNDGLAVMSGFAFPEYYAQGGRVWRVRQGERKAVDLDGAAERKSPLPGLLATIPLPRVLVSAVWSARGFMGQKYKIKIVVGGSTVLKAQLTARIIVSTMIGAGVSLYANLVRMPWYLTNLQGFAFSYTALQLMSPTTFGTGSLILVALFFYDIYFVFFTPLMITVASNLDVPIKLLVPRPEDPLRPGVQALAMLGLGDIVLPGIMIGLALRFDLYMHYLRLQTKKTLTTPSESTEAKEDDIVKAPYRSPTGNWGSYLWTTTFPYFPVANPSILKTALPTFAKPYFSAAIAGYILGMIITLNIMLVFTHGQPALLYLVPGVLGAVWLTALLRGEVSEMWAYTEAIDGSADDDDDEKKKTETAATEETKKDTTWSEWFSDSFFGSKKADKNAEKLKKMVTGPEDEDKATKSADEKNQKEGPWFAFSFSRLEAKPKANNKVAPESQKELQNGTRFRGQNNSGITNTHTRDQSASDMSDRPGKRVRTS